MDVETLTGARTVLDRAGPVLLADEPRHNLALGILSFTLEHPDVYPELRGWVARERGTVVGAALRTPPYNLVLARPQRPSVLEAIASAIEEELPGVVGAVPEVDAFAGLWAARHPVTATTRFDHGIYSLRTVVPPRGVDGGLQLAGVAERPLVLAWLTAFTEEALHGTDDPERIERSVDARLGGAGSGGMALWEVDSVPVSLAGFGGPTPNGLRIGPVYTPPEHRGHGYGSAVTAAVSQLALDRGKRFCFLYTDLANPTSNAIYMRIGYERVCDSREVAFTSATG